MRVFDVYEVNSPGQGFGTTHHAIGSDYDRHTFPSKVVSFDEYELLFLELQKTLVALTAVTESVSRSIDIAEIESVSMDRDTGE